MDDIIHTQAKNSVVEGQLVFELFDTLGDDANRFAPYMTDNWYIILGLATMGYLIFRWVPVRGQYPDINFRTRPLLGLVATAAFGGLWLLAQGGPTLHEVARAWSCLDQPSRLQQVIGLKHRGRTQVPGGDGLAHGGQPFAGLNGP